MSLKETPVCNFGEKIKDFKLISTEDTFVSLKDIKGQNGTLIMFICNHCPYVKAIKTRLVDDCRELLQYGINTIAIQSNDTENYPEDSYERMMEEAKLFHFPFPYVLDETQEVAKAYGAVCTPDFFGFNADLELQYRGRFDAAGRRQSDENHPRDLFNAMKLIAEKLPADAFLRIHKSSEPLFY